MELPSQFNNHKKSLQQGISLLGNGDLISNSKLIALVTQVMGSGRDVVDLLASRANFNIIIMAMVLPIKNGVEVSLSFLYCECKVC
ncbi:hypothetical protein AAG906_011886 [Vitis piasezkii]